MARVAICEDDAVLRSALRRAFEGDGYDVVAAVTGAELLSLAARTPPDVVVLDIGLPDADGRDVCSALRSHGVAAPLLLLTALDGMHNKVSGLQAGADDYLTKPFDLPELLARVEALLRRTTTRIEADHGLVLDPGRHSVGGHGREVPLSPTEFRLLARLVGSPDTVVRRRHLVAAGWPHGAIVSENTLDSYLRRVRSKLTEVGAGDRIRTVRGVGYRWH
ncbi:MAG: response regulator transcription factor [Marmoricola sp.]